MCYFVWKNIVRFAHGQFGFTLLYLFVLTFAMKLRNANRKIYLNIWFFASNEKWCQIWIYPLEKCDFVSFSLSEFTLVIKLRNFDFESHRNTLIFFDKRRYSVRFQYVLWKNVWFSLIFIVWVDFSHKTEKFWFWKSLKYFDIFRLKKMKSDLNTPEQTMSDLV